MNVWIIVFFLSGGSVYPDYALCHSKLCVERVVAAAEMDHKIYRYEVLRDGDDPPPFQREQPALDVWKNT